MPPQVAAPLRLLQLLPISQTLVPAPAPAPSPAPLLLHHLSRRLFTSSGRAASLRAPAYRRHPHHPHPRRGSSTLRTPPGEEMAGGGDKEVVAAFNRKRAEGNDGGKRGSMGLKTRKLNPVNTTCYVQVRYICSTDLT